MKLQLVPVALTAVAIVSCTVWVISSGKEKAAKRRESLTKSEREQKRGNEKIRSRREEVEATLRDLENRNRNANNLAKRIEHAGLSISKNQFILFSALFGGGIMLLVFTSGGGLLAALGFAFAAGFGLPRWILGFLKRRREKKFLEALPDAIDLIVRGIKSGLPLFDSIRMVATEAPEPLRSEFATIVETQSIGMPLGEACTRLYERMPVAEANFFGIVVSIQQKAGGNLSEALGNLSKVLRERKKMRGKIQAMSMEAKASAAIIGSLPPLVGIALFFMSPDYISLLWTHPTGRIMMVGGALWMTMGTLVMKKMINFDF